VHCTCTYSNEFPEDVDGETIGVEKMVKSDCWTGQESQMV
jgi:hypothetical protein